MDEAPTGRYVTAIISPRWGFDHLSTNSWGLAPGFHLSPLWGKNTLFSWFFYTFTGAAPSLIRKPLMPDEHGFQNPGQTRQFVNPPLPKSQRLRKSRGDHSSLASCTILVPRLTGLSELSAVVSELLLAESELSAVV